tara:strand:+ start:1379 stop:1882 length:504 start_codon:yes stop_codon:yes gene_type:complete
LKNKYYIIINLLLPLLVVSCGDNPTETIDSYTGITETDTNGNFIGNIDTEDWCEFEFDFESMNSNYGLNPIYPNPVNAQQWGPFGNSYQICYQYSTPYDDSWTNFNQVDINIINFEGDTIYSLIDSYANGQVGMCAYITDSLVVSSVYRMNMKSGEFECHGDIQFVQ